MCRMWRLKPFHGFEKTERGEKNFLFLFLLPLKYLRRTNVAMEHNIEYVFTSQFSLIKP